MRGIWKIIASGVALITAVISGLLIAFVSQKVIAIEYGAIGLIITFTLVIIGIVTYWRIEKEKTP